MVIEDLRLIVEMASELSLQLNHCNSEVISIMYTIILYIPGARVIDPINATLLGSPLGDVSSISELLFNKLGSKIQQLFSHDAILLRYSFSIPKLYMFLT